MRNESLVHPSHHLRTRQFLEIGEKGYLFLDVHVSQSNMEGRQARERTCNQFVFVEEVHRVLYGQNLDGAESRVKVWIMTRMWRESSCSNDSEQPARRQQKHRTDP